MAKLARMTAPRFVQAAMVPMDRLRIDKWLWAARFYKTRSLACEAIDLGRVWVNGASVKPARELKVADNVQLRLGPQTRTVTVLQISDKRGNAQAAALLFCETPESISQREAATLARRLSPEPALSLLQGRPTKRDRRQMSLLEQSGQSQSRRQPLDNTDWGPRWSASIDRRG